MKQFICSLLTTFLLLTWSKGICSDSAYICIRSNRLPDKPYHEFVFYKKGGYNPDQDPISYGGNLFSSQIALSEERFSELKINLFTEYHRSDTSKKTDPLFKSYFIAYIDGSKLLLINDMNNYIDFIETSNIVNEFFKGTKYETEIKNRWTMVFDRLGIKTK